MRQPTLFDGDRMDLGDSIGLTIQSLQEYGARYRHWAIAYSGGKDSTTVLTLTLHLVKAGRIPRPDRLTVCYADTRMELPPLAAAAREMLRLVAAEGFDTRVAMAPLDSRYFVYMLGRGVPPPNNQTFRWCTEQIKVEPMESELERICVELGFGRFIDGKYRSHDQDAFEADERWVEVNSLLQKARRERARLEKSGLVSIVMFGQGDALFDVSRRIEGLERDLMAESRRVVPDPHKVLMLTGVRLGESAARDGRIALACGKNGSECGQGWYQETLPEHVCDTLSPILHWRTCLVWDWLSGLAPPEYRHGYPTRLVADAYGLDEEGSEAEIGARTGCVGCPLANRDSAIDGLLRFPRWQYLRPLKELRPLYRWLREPAQRLRMPGGETRKDGTLSRNQNRMGPLTMAARRTALARIREIQAECNRLRPPGVEPVDILNPEEVARIRELMAANTWPQKWTGDEPTGDEPYEGWDQSGFVQGILLPREGR